jgi:hypothetical protein
MFDGREQIWWHYKAILALLKDSKSINCHCRCIDPGKESKDGHKSCIHCLGGF